MSSDLNKINAHFMKVCKSTKTLNEIAVKKNSANDYSINCINPYINYESDSGEYVTLEDIKREKVNINEINGMYKQKFKPILYGAEDGIFSVGGNYNESSTLNINSMRKSGTIINDINSVGDNEYNEKVEKNKAGVNEPSVKNQTRVRSNYVK
ncbi:hypothetical protein MACJ_002306 [Theileria orientalis]|uniref:Uncharacterized protein n=1 Tax=Theileria orientalis TaxID=68886 RepID=A0A976M610_THEOR|nr:hypothetical protein MACJ_002306 [Theileria orientalis]